MHPQRWLTLVVGMIAAVHTTKILLMPSLHGGHVNFFSVAGTILRDDGGHQVHALVAKEFSKLMLKQNIKSYIEDDEQEAKVKEEGINRMVSLAGESMFMMVIHVRTTLVAITAATNVWCQHVLDNTTMMNEIKSQNYDLAIVDGIDFSGCLLVIVNHLKLKYVILNARHDPWSCGLAVSPGVEGLLGINVMGSDAGLLDRLKNLVFFTLTYNLGPRNDVPTQMVTKYTDAKDILELYKRAELFFINREVVLLDQPRVYAPHIRFLGGLAAHDVQPLSAEVSEFIAGSGAHGIIVVSFGSAVTTLSPELIQNLFAAFRTVKQRVLMRLVGKFENVPKNMKILKWLPQNDLLGNAKTRLFVTHSGANGMVEGLHHGVPMLMIPLFGDMINNAQNGVDKGYGVMVMPRLATEETLTKTLETMLAPDNVYTKNIRRASTIFHSLPKASAELNFWVRHIITYGGDHLKPSSYHRPLYQSLNVDLYILIFVLFSLLSSVTLYVIYSISRCFFKRLFKSKDKKRTYSKRKTH